MLTPNRHLLKGGFAEVAIKGGESISVRMGPHPPEPKISATQVNEKRELVEQAKLLGELRESKVLRNREILKMRARYSRF